MRQSQVLSNWKSQLAEVFCLEAPAVQHTAMSTLLEGHLKYIRLAVSCNRTLQPPAKPTSQTAAVCAHVQGRLQSSTEQMLHGCVGPEHLASMA